MKMSDFIKFVLILPENSFDPDIAKIVVIEKEIEKLKAEIEKKTLEIYAVAQEHWSVPELVEAIRETHGRSAICARCLKLNKIALSEFELSGGDGWCGQAHKHNCLQHLERIDDDHKDQYTCKICHEFWDDESIDAKAQSDLADYNNGKIEESYYLKK